METQKRHYVLTLFQQATCNGLGWVGSVESVSIEVDPVAWLVFEVCTLNSYSVESMSCHPGRRAAGSNERASVTRVD
jgi:hypothetical protein